MLPEGFPFHQFYITEKTPYKFNMPLFKLSFKAAVLRCSKMGETLTVNTGQVMFNGEIYYY